LRLEVIEVLLVALEPVWEDRRAFGTNEVLLEPFGRTYGHEARCTAKSIPGNATLASHLITSIFMF
jgi:hypothetical protein